MAEWRSDGQMQEHCALVRVVWRFRCSQDADAETRSFRILFAHETKFILLSPSAFEKRTQKTPIAEIELAEDRLESRRASGWARLQLPTRPAPRRHEPGWRRTDKA